MDEDQKLIAKGILILLLSLFGLILTSIVCDAIVESIKATHGIEVSK